MKSHDDGETGSWARSKIRRVMHGLKPRALPKFVAAPSYSRHDAERIRQLVATPGAKILCPQCDEELTMGLPIAGGGSLAFVWQPQCTSCGRCLFLTDPPEQPPKDQTRKWRGRKSKRLGHTATLAMWNTSDRTALKPLPAN